MNILIKPSTKELFRRGFNDIGFFVREILQEDLHKGQEKYLTNSSFKQFAFLHAGNRYGKGDIAKFKGAWMAFYKPVAKQWKHKEICLLNTSISQDQANIVLNKFENTIANKPIFAWLISDIKHSPFPHIIFKNNVIWWFRNASQEGRFLLGRSYLWINFDEADYAKNITSLISEVIEPRTWDYGGYVDIMTTPKGKKNAYKLYKERLQQNDPRNYFQQGDTRDNPFINQERLKERITKMPARLIQQNVAGAWVDSIGLITTEAIHASQQLATGLQALPTSGAIYINIWDLARRSTYLVGITIQVKPSIQVVSFERSREDRDSPEKDYWHNTIRKIENRHNLWKGKTVIDKTGLGDVVLEYIPKSVAATGYDLGTSDGTGTRIKNAITQNGVAMINFNQVGIPAEVEQITEDGTWTAEDELRDFQENTKGLIWDFVCALFIGLYAISKPEHRAVPSVPGVKGASKYGNP